MSKTRVLIIRHGETDSNLAGKLDGQVETTLTEKGIAQAEQLGELLAEEQIDIAFASPLNRSQETAKIVLKHHGVEIVTEQTMMEIDCGDCTLRFRDDVIKEFPDLAKGWEEQVDPPFPNGESLRDVQARVMPFIKKILKEHEGKTILLSGHGALNRAIIGAFLEVPAGLCWNIDQSNCCLNEISFRGDKYTVKRVNHDPALGVLKKE
ncbi:MAG TPA: histidine phosphatase family protein [Candidatus Woesearchaeota archaeon]|nr:histidine phosphatase family protein [Candidatus Woesearchaeota archaeon]